MKLATPNTPLHQILERMANAAAQAGRPPSAVQLIAVSKKQPIEAIEALYAAGQHRFGESYIQEAQKKINQLKDVPLEWHFIGPIQSNKTRPIAALFSWVHSVDRLSIAQRLNDQRPAELPPLNICLQVNISHETSKSGVLIDSEAQYEALAILASAIGRLPRLQLRGLMAIPAHSTDPIAQRQAFHRVYLAQRFLNEQGIALDSLSMGMSDDLEAAIAEGATMVRVGTALFGQRSA